MTPRKITQIYIILFLSVTLFGVTGSKHFQADNSCGPRCIEAILRLSGNYSTGIADIYNIIGKDPFQVTTLKDLKNAATQLGYTVDGYKSEIKELRKFDGYLILHIILPDSNSNGYHFILAQNATEDHIQVIDTETLDNSLWSLEKLNELWTEYVLVIKDKTNERGNSEVERIKNENENSSKVKLENSKDFGNVESGSLLIYTFKIEDNETVITNATVIHKNCSCLEPKIFKSRDEFLLSLKMSATDAGSQSAFVDVRIEPSKKVKRYSLKAYCIDHYTMTPKIAYLEANEGERVKCQINIKYFTDIIT